MAVNPDDYLHLVLKRRSEDWGTAYIALSGAVDTFDESKGLDFGNYAYHRIGFALKEEELKERGGGRRIRNGKAGYTKSYGMDCVFERVKQVSFVMPKDEYKPKPLRNPRLAEVRDMLARGMTQQQIAAALGVSDSAIWQRMRFLRDAYGTSASENRKRNKRGREEAANGASDGVPDTHQARSA